MYLDKIIFGNWSVCVSMSVLSIMDKYVTERQTIQSEFA